MENETGRDQEHVHHLAPALLCVELVGSRNCMIEPQLQFGEFGEYRLIGIVYFGGFHFISRIITTDKNVYLHDGMNGAYATYEGCIGVDFQVEGLGCCEDKTVSLAIYVAD